MVSPRAYGDRDRPAPGLVDWADPQLPTAPWHAISPSGSPTPTHRRPATDYILALKGNQGNLHAQVVEVFKDAGSEPFESVSPTFHETQDEKHGRREVRRVAGKRSSSRRVGSV